MKRDTKKLGSIASPLAKVVMKEEEVERKYQDDGGKDSKDESMDHNLSLKLNLSLSLNLKLILSLNLNQFLSLNLSLNLSQNLNLSLSLSLSLNLNLSLSLNQSLKLNLSLMFYILGMTSIVNESSHTITLRFTSIWICKKNTYNIYTQK